MIIAIAGLILAIAGVVAAIFAILSEELKNNPRLRYSVFYGLLFLTLLAGVLSFYGFANLTEPNVSSASNKTAVDISTLKISSVNASGTQWCAQTTAKYTIEYESGAYSVWGNKSDCEGGCWSTDVYVYQNRNVEWTSQGEASLPAHPDFEIGWPNTYVKQEDAENITRGAKNSFEVYVDAGKCLTFITLDSQTSYNDNFGEITLRVKLIEG